MNNKFILLDPEEMCINHKNRIMHRIKAISSFGDVKAGDIGGYVENESNLCGEAGTTCWVYDDAKVVGTSVVYNDAIVSKEATVIDSIISGKSMVTDEAFVNLSEISGESCICEQADVTNRSTIYGDCYISGNARIFKSSIIGPVKIIERAYISCSDILASGSPFSYNIIISGNVVVMDKSKIRGYVRLSGNSVFKEAVIMEFSTDKLTASELNQKMKDFFRGEATDNAVSFGEHLQQMENAKLLKMKMEESGISRDELDKILRQLYFVGLK